MVLDQAVRSLPLGGAYPLGELSGGGKEETTWSLLIIAAEFQ